MEHELNEADHCIKDSPISDDKNQELNSSVFNLLNFCYYF